MEIPLTGFEAEILNKAIPTQTLSKPEHLQLELIGIADNEKSNLMKSEQINEQDFNKLKIQAVKNIIQFLVSNGFFYVNDSGAFFITEKLRHLRQQGSIQKYFEWEIQAQKNAAEILHTIETRGYLNEDQDPEIHPDNSWKELNSLDYNVLDEGNPGAHHVIHKSHHFESKPGEISGRANDRRTRLIITIFVLIILLFLFMRYF